MSIRDSNNGPELILPVIVLAVSSPLILIAIFGIIEWLLNLF